MREIHPGSPTKAALRVVELSGRRLVVKDVRPLHPWVRALYGRWVLRREERALRWLDGTPGVRRLLARIDEDAIALEHVDGEPLRRQLGAERIARACERLGPRVAELHRRGAVHLDLRQKRNILVDAQGEVFLVDFQSALLFPAGGVGGWLLRRLRWVDENAVLKFRARYAPQLLTDAERARARRQRWLGRLWIFHRFGPLLRAVFGGGRERAPRRSP